LAANYNATGNGGGESSAAELHPGYGGRIGTNSGGDARFGTTL